MSPTVSFIITIYNKASYIPRMLSGLYHQEGHFSREYIFIDDGSEDNSVQLLKDLTAEWQDVRILCQSNKGASSALNAGIKEARGQYLKFVDGDDILVHNSTEQMLLAVEQFRVPIVFGKLKTSSDPALPPLYRLPTSVKKILLENPLISLLKSQYHQINSIGATPSLVSREAALAVGGADERSRLQDFSFALKLFQTYQAVFLDAIVCFCPEETHNRLSSDKAKEGYHTLVTLRTFLEEHSGSTLIYKLSVKRATKRAYETGSSLPFSKRLLYKIIRKVAWPFFIKKEWCLMLINRMIQDMHPSYSASTPPSQRS